MTVQSKESTSIISGLFWKFMESGGSQGVQFIIAVLLARLLSPKEYDIVAVVMIFITIANVLVQHGFATALIQKKEADSLDYSSVLYAGMLFALIIYVILYALSPYIAGFYKNNTMAAVIRVMSLIIFPGSVISVWNAYISRHMLFRKLCIATLIASLISGAVSVYMAGLGYGVWSLVLQQLIYYFALCILLVLSVRVGIQKSYSYSRLKEMFGFGSKLLLASLLDNIVNNIHGLFMGKVYTAGVLGLYNRGEQFPKIIVTNLGIAIQSVMLPVMSRQQEDKARLKEYLMRTIKLSTYIVFPMMAGLMASADSLIYVLLGDKWMGAVPYLVLMCVSYACWPLHIANLQAINAIGRSDVFLGLEVVKKGLSIIMLVIGIRYSAVVLIMLKVVADILCVAINLSPSKKLYDYSMWSQFRDIAPSLVLSTIMGVSVYFIGSFMHIGIVRFIVQVISGICIYICLSYISNNENFISISKTSASIRG